MYLMTIEESIGLETWEVYLFNALGVLVQTCLVFVAKTGRWNVRSEIIVLSVHHKDKRSLDSFGLK